MEHQPQLKSKQLIQTTAVPRLHRGSAGIARPSLCFRREDRGDGTSAGHVGEIGIAIGSS